jgi:hemolysin activation/secretion protein
MKGGNFAWRHGEWEIVAAGVILQALLATAAFGAQAKKSVPASAEPAIQNVTNLQGIVIVPSEKDAKARGVRGIRGVKIVGPEFLRHRDFEKMLKRHIGSPLTETNLTKVQVEIRNYCQAHNHLVVDVLSIEQTILEGTVQIAVIEGRIDAITVTNAGRKWFSDKVITNNVRLKTGGVVLENRLNDDLTWLNQDTFQNLGSDQFGGWFLDVNADLSQGKELGTTSVKLDVQDRLPLRGFVGVDDAGITVVGTEQIFVGADVANPYWLGNRLSYEYVSDIDFNKFSEHVGTIVLPTFGRNELTLFGTYANLNPDYSIISPSLKNLTSEGFFYQLTARYAVPLPTSQNYNHEITGGFDFKRTDTPLLFEAGGLLNTNNIGVAQFMLGYSGRFRDPWGSGALSVQGFYSPGGIGQYNTEAAFNDFQQGTTPEYVYARGEIRHLTSLPYGFSWYTRAAGQFSDARLVATEVFSLGGWDSVRGYDQNVVSGDNGWLLVNELRTKQFSLFGNLHGKGAYDQNDAWGSIRQGKIHGMDWIQLLAFCDYGGAYYRTPPPEGFASRQILLSVGVGFRYQLAQNFMARFDYGWQLDRSYVTVPGAATLGPQPTSRAHFGLELTF